MRILAIMPVVLASCTSSYITWEAYKIIDGAKAEYPIRYTEQERNDLTRLVKKLNREYRIYGNLDKR